MKSLNTRVTVFRLVKPIFKIFLISPEMSEVTYNIIYDTVGMIAWLLRKDKRKVKNNINKN